MSDPQLPPLQPRGRRPSTASSRRTLAIIIAVAVVGALVTNAFVIVDPTEMAGKRLLGRVVVDHPLGPGLHFKLPLVEKIDKLQTSLETYKLDRLTVNTVDNQPITVAVGLTYRIPADAVLKLLYEVGRAGNVDIGENFQRVIADRTAKIFAQQNTTTISENRERLSINGAQGASVDRSRPALRDRGRRFSDCRDHIFRQLPGLGRGGGQSKERGGRRGKHGKSHPLRGAAGGGPGER